MTWLGRRAIELALLDTERARDDREDEIARLKSKVGEITLGRLSKRSQVSQNRAALHGRQAHRHNGQRLHRLAQKVGR